MPTDKYVLRISKPNLGKNVDDCTDDELVFNSEREVLKVPLNGIGTGVTGSVITHGLGYVPLFLVCERYTRDTVERATLLGDDRGASCNENYLYMNDYYTNRSYKYYFFYKHGV